MKMKRNNVKGTGAVVALLSAGLFFACHREGKMQMPMVSPQEMTLQESGIKNGDLLKPVNETVIASVVMIHPERKMLPVVVQAEGYIAYNTENYSTVAARFGGRIEKLDVKYNFQPVVKGERLFTVYSPELVTAEENYLFLLRNDAQNTTLVDAAKQRLLLLGITESELAAVKSSGKVQQVVSVYSPVSGFLVEEKNSTAIKPEMPGMKMDNGPSTGMGNNANDYRASDGMLSVKEGQYVSKGETVFRVVNNTTMWGMAKIVGDEGALVRKGQPVLLIPESTPSDSVRAQVNFVEPVLNEKESAVTARIVLGNPGRRFVNGSFFKCSIATGGKEALWLNRSAVLDLGNRRVVLVAENGHVFHVREVGTGIVNGDVIEITGGVSENDAVASDAQYLIDSQSFIKTVVK